MNQYKVTTIGFYPDFSLLYGQIFGNAVHVASEVQGNVAYYTFSEPVTPADLGPLVKVERVTDLSTLP